MSLKVAIIGANEQQNPLILKAKSLGYETHSFAWQTGREIGEHTSDFFYPISGSKKEEILEKCKEIGVDAVVSIGSDITAQTCAYISQALSLKGNAYESVMNASNKRFLRQTLNKLKIPQPKYVEIGDTLPFDELNDLTYPVVVKPTDRSGSRGLSLVRDPNMLLSAINNAREISFERKAIVEEYINGFLYSCECLSYDGKHSVIAITGRDVEVLQASFCEHRHYMPAILPATVETKIRHTCVAILEALNLNNGASSVEFIVDSNNIPYIIEVTPSMYGDYIGTDLVPLAYGFDYTKAVLEIARGIKPEFSLSIPQNYAQVEFEYDKATGSRGKHSITASPIKEFGGCIPFRITERSPYFEESETTIALNSEYTAFWCALKHLNAKRVHIPYYASSAWERVAKELDIECKYYHINEHFLPTDISADADDAVLLINYHGLCTEYIKTAPYKNKIVDNSMVFFEKPFMDENICTIYSARKFFSVADGAYLVSNALDLPSYCLETDVSYKRIKTMFHALESGAGEAYKEQQAIEQELMPSRKAMSVLTKKLLSSIDYQKEKNARLRNFNILHKYLKTHNMIFINQTEDYVPQFYPLLVSAKIREVLIEKKIYIPLMWRRTLNEEFEGLAEKLFSEKLVCLPIEPDYSENDMEYLAKVVIAALS